MNYLGDFAVGSTVYVMFNTFDGSGASVTMTGFDVTDIEIYKNGSVTQRSNDAGYTLLDTDGIDFDGVTGLHGFSIDTSDNTVDGFFTAGADYFVQVNGLTVDSQSVAFIAASFSIENRRVAGEMVKTTIATLASQTSFTLTAGSTDDNAYNNCKALVSDKASGVQKCIGIISDYTGATKTITLLADPGIFTMAAGDNVTILATDSGLMSTPEDIRSEIDSNSTQLAAIVADTNEMQGDLTNGGRLDLILDELTTQGDNNELLLHAISGLIGTPSVDLATDIAGIALGSGMTEDTWLAYFMGLSYQGEA